MGEEPLQFFCLQCEEECLCAECALHGDHQGHEVENIRSAVHHVPEKAQELISAVRSRLEELNGLEGQLQAAKQEVMDVTQRGKLKISDSFALLRGSTEQNLLA